MADEQDIDVIGVGLTLDTTRFDRALKAADSKLSAFQGKRQAVLSTPQTVSITPAFTVNQSHIRALKVDINDQFSRMAARHEAVAIPVKLGNSDWAGMRQQIARRIGSVPIQVHLSSMGQVQSRAAASGLWTPGQRSTAGQTDIGPLLAWIAQSQGGSVVDAGRRIRQAAASRGIAGRASGGPVSQDRPYLVGENGPEIMYPRTSGTVMPIRPAYQGKRVQGYGGRAGRFRPGTVRSPALSLSASWQDSTLPNIYRVSAQDLMNKTMESRFRGQLRLRSGGFDPDYLGEISRSMLEEGQRSPVDVRWDRDLGKWFIYDGNHRVAAAATSDDPRLKNLWATFSGPNERYRYPYGTPFVHPRMAGIGKRRELGGFAGFGLDKILPRNMATSLFAGIGGPRVPFNRVTAMDAYGPMSRALEASLRGASSSTIRKGLDWYGLEGRRLQEMAASRGISAETLAAIVAKFSQNSPWPSNALNALMFTDYFGRNDPRRHQLKLPTGQGIYATGEARAQAEGLLRGHFSSPLDIVTGPKDIAFARALLGNPQASALDRMVARAMLQNQAVLPPALRHAGDIAIRRAADQRGWSPAGTQAIAWYQGGGGNLETAAAEAKIASYLDANPTGGFLDPAFEQMWKRGPDGILIPRAQGGRAKRGGLPRGLKMEFWGRNGRPGSFGGPSISINDGSGWTTPSNVAAGWNPEVDLGGEGLLPSGPWLPSNFERLSRPTFPEPGRPRSHWPSGFTVVVKNRAGEIVGMAPFNTEMVSLLGEDDYVLHPQKTWVRDDYRRRGIASSMYSRAERWAGRKIRPADIQSADAKALWGQSGRPFGIKGASTGIFASAMRPEVGLSRTPEEAMALRRTAPRLAWFDRVLPGLLKSAGYPVTGLSELIGGYMGDVEPSGFLRLAEGTSPDTLRMVAALAGKQGRKAGEQQDATILAAIGRSSLGGLKPNASMFRVGLGNRTPADLGAVHRAIVDAGLEAGFSMRPGRRSSLQFLLSEGTQEYLGGRGSIMERLGSIAGAVGGSVLGPVPAFMEALERYKGLASYLSPVGTYHGTMYGPKGTMAERLALHALRSSAPDRSGGTRFEYPFVGDVSTKTLLSMARELRETEPRYRGDPFLDELTAKIGAEGFDRSSPVEIAYDPTSRRALLSDGNHRLAAALRLGMDSLPAMVRAVRTSKPHWRSKPVPGTKAELYPGQRLYPSDIGLRAAGGPVMDFTGVRADLQPRVSDTLGYLLRQYPAVGETLKSVGLQRMLPRYAAWDSQAGRLMLSGEAFAAGESSRHVLSSVTGRMLKDKGYFFPGLGSAESAVTHEFAHALRSHIEAQNRAGKMRETSRALMKLEDLLWQDPADLRSRPGFEKFFGVSRYAESAREMPSIMGGGAFEPFAELFSGLHRPESRLDKMPQPLLDSMAKMLVSFRLGRSVGGGVIGPAGGAETMHVALGRRAAGGSAGAGTYLVGELAPELFVPDRLRYIIPPEVMAQIPKRDQGGAVRKLGSGVVEVGTRGPHFFSPEEDGWIIPHNLVGKVSPNVPRAFQGLVGPGGQPIGTIQPGITAEELIQGFNWALSEANIGRVGGMQMLAGRNPAAIAAGWGSNTLGGRVDMLKAQSRATLESQRLSRFVHEYANEIVAATNAQAQGTQLTQQQQDVLNNLNTQIVKTTEAHKQALPGLKGTLKAGLASIGAFTAYGAVIGGVGALMAAAKPQFDRWFDSISGFTATNQKVTKGLGDQLRQQGGNVGAVFGQMAMQSGLGVGAQAFLQSTLAGSAFAKAGGAAQGEKSDLFKAAAGIISPTGLIGGYGGIGGSAFLGEFMGGGKGLAEQIGLDLKDLNQKANARAPEFGILAELLFPEDVAKTRQGALEAKKAAGAAREAYAADLTDSMKRGAMSLGEAANSMMSVAGLADDVVKSFKDLGSEAADMVEGGYVMVDEQGKVIADQKKYRAALGQIAVGNTMPTSQAYASLQARQLRAGRMASAEQRRFGDIMSLGQMGVDLLANPFISPEAAIFSGGGPQITGLSAGTGLNADYESGLVGRLAATREDQLKVEEQYAGNVDRLAQEIGKTNPELVGKFRSLAAEIGGIGETMAELQEGILRTQAGISETEYKNNLRLARRAREDALGLAGKATGPGNLGALQLQQFKIERTLQQLGFALTQRQINFSIATAGFTAPGATPEERQANIEQARYEASFQQQQLDLNKQLFVIAGSQFQISADRALEDAQIAIEVLEANRRAEMDIAVANAALAVEAKRLAPLQAEMGGLLGKVQTDFGSILQSAAGYVAQFGGTVAAATSVIMAAVGQGAASTLTGTSRYGGKTSAFQAEGWYGTVGMPTQMVVGEAGTETVAILRNPRQGYMPSSGGGSVGNISVNIAVSGGSSDPEALAQAVAAKVEETLNRRLSLMGLRSYR